MVGDGSGNNWEYPCAFAAYLIEARSNWRDVFFGGFNCGTNNYAELNAYCNPLDWLSDLDAVQRTESGACRIHILSDSEWVVNAGNGVWPRNSHKPTWAKYEAYRKFGFFIKWHWIPGHRGIPANEFCDSLAGMTRLLIKDLDWTTAFETAGLKERSLRAMYPAPKPKETGHA